MKIKRRHINFALFFVLNGAFTYAMSGIYGRNAGFFDAVFTKNDFKFLFADVMAIAIAVLAQWRDRHKDDPTAVDLVFSLVLTIAFVVLVYESAIWLDWSAVVGMLLTFVFGAFSLKIYGYVDKNIVRALDRLLDRYLKKTKGDE